MAAPKTRAVKHPNGPDVARIVRHFFDRGLPVGMICHGPKVLEKSIVPA